MKNIYFSYIGEVICVTLHVYIIWSCSWIYVMGFCEQYSVLWKKGPKKRQMKIST